MPKEKLTIEEVKNKLKSISPNINILSNEYINNKTKLSCKCLIDGYEWKAIWSSLQRGTGCPKLYFVDSMTYGEALEPWVEHKWGEDDISYSGYQVVREYNEETKLWNKFKRDESITQKDFVNKEYNEFYKSKLQRLEDEDSDKEYAFDYFKELIKYDNVVVVGIKDMNKVGGKSSPRYYIYVVVDKNNFTQETFNNFYYELKDNIRESNYSNRKTYEHQFALEDCFSEIEKIKDCDYKYYKEGIK